MSRSAARLPAFQEKKMLMQLLPDQGAWSEEGYLWLTDHSSRLVEFSDGFLEVLPMPTDRHQAILGFLYLSFHLFLFPRGGKVRFAPLRLRLWAGKFREPDLLLLRDATDPRGQDRFWTGADLVLEIVSKDHPERDLIQKRHEYARARIPEYLIVNPLKETILVFRLKGKNYQKPGQFARGAKAVSHLLPDFSVEVDEVFDAE
jgi:Uma2 family endonuclease